ncbi:MAG: hypothetical protein AAF512_17555 [Pseudomonadota bacterium]
MSFLNKNIVRLSIFTFGLFAFQAQSAVFNPLEDVMTSSFFQGNNLVRGYSGDGRNVHRVSTNNPFGTSGAETIYLDFSDSDFSSFSGSPVSATLTLTSTSGGFFADAGPGNPFTVSAHGVDADPLASITDDTNPGGPIAWNDFYANNILAASAAASTVISSFGLVTFDISALVNDWISGSNSFQFVAMTGLNDTSGNEFLHGFLNNTENPGASFLEVSAVPLPAAAWLFISAVVGTLGIGRMRRKSTAADESLATAA